MKKYLLGFLFTLLLFVPMASCKGFEKTDIYYEVASVFTEKAVKQLFDAEFSFDKKGKIHFEKTFTIDEIVNILGNKLSQKLTYNGYAQVKTELVHTKISWVTSDDKHEVNITFDRQKY